VYLFTTNIMGSGASIEDGHGKAGGWLPLTYTITTPHYTTPKRTLLKPVYAHQTPNMTMPIGMMYDIASSAA
jgi:hypothetical protein